LIRAGESWRNFRARAAPRLRAARRGTRPSCPPSPVSFPRSPLGRRDLSVSALDLERLLPVSARRADCGRRIARTTREAGRRHGRTWPRRRKRLVFSLFTMSRYRRIAFGPKAKGHNE